jgi:hypothetical protein
MDNLLKELLKATGEVSPELREKMRNAAQEVANDPDITPVEAFSRGAKVGIEVIGEGLRDRVETLRVAFQKEKKKKGK